MVRFTKEGDKLKYGFRLKYSNNKIFYFRYSKLRDKLVIGHIVDNQREKSTSSDI